LATKKNASNQMYSFTKKNYRNFRTDARYFPFEARKETHQQHKTKIDIDKFRSRTTNITLNEIYLFQNSPVQPLPWLLCPFWQGLAILIAMRMRRYNAGHIAPSSASVASCEATRCRHRVSACAVLPWWPPWPTISNETQKH
jgi:hypothetical protein